jgi:hypothetical protein
MRIFRILTTIIFLALIASSQSALAETPPAERQLVYALEVFEGFGYASTFGPVNEEVIYLLADHDNALSPRYTMVYYWPLTRSYRTDWETLNEPVVDATLQVFSDGELFTSEAATVFSVEFPGGYGSRDSSLHWGSAAGTLFERTNIERIDYYSAVREYQTEYQDYQERYEDYLDAMLDETITDKPSAPEEPREPEPYLKMVTPPTIGFRLNLPVGDYKIEIINPEGEIIPGSEKEIVVFSHRRTGIGYNIIPESRWTQPERSDDPLETIYVDSVSNKALYLQPFIEAEFNEAYYLGLLDPQDHSGSVDRWIWAHFDPYSPGTLVLVDRATGDELMLVEEMPFKIIQTPGPQLGYQVVEFSGEISSTQRPSFVGYEIDLANMRDKVIFRLLDMDGDVVQGSEREIRWLPRGRPFVQYLWIGTPILVGGLIILWRKSRSENS